MEREENKCAVIAEYENAKDIPAAERCTEYAEEFRMYMFRLDADPSLINERYAAAKAASEGRVLADGKKLTAVFRKTLLGNIQDTARFSLLQEEEMLRMFYDADVTEKKLGVNIGEDTIFLIRWGDKREVPPEMISLPFGVYETRYMERLDELRSRWYKKLLLLDYSKYQNEVKEITESVGSNRERKQPEFNYAKEIRKRMKVSEKVFFDEHMEGYDFREVDLQGAIFIHCNLANSNFSHCNMEDVFFFQCELKGCDWYEAILNGCMVYYGGNLVQMKDFSRRGNR